MPSPEKAAELLVKNVLSFLGDHHDATLAVEIESLMANGEHGLALELFCDGLPPGIEEDEPVLFTAIESADQAMGGILSPVLMRYLRGGDVPTEKFMEPSAFDSWSEQGKAHVKSLHQAGASLESILDRAGAGSKIEELRLIRRVTGCSLAEAVARWQAMGRLHLGG